MLPGKVGICKLMGLLCLLSLGATGKQHTQQQQQQQSLLRDGGIVL
jgi:hypothetical protein